MPISQVPFAGISNPVDFRNIVINGDMQVAQRSTSVSSITTSGYYTVDRFATGISSLGTWTQSQSTDVPTGQGFATSLKMDCTTADASPAASDTLTIRTNFEGQNLQYLKKGTANALPLTLSFWVKSTKTGTFIIQIRDIDNARSISKSYTVSVSNTWEKKTITFEGDTTGVLDNNNGLSLTVDFWLGAGTDHTSGTLQNTWGARVIANDAVGQVNVADSDANDWYITGVQLEAGEQASGFEFMPIDVNLGRCQRYFYMWVPAGSGYRSIGSFSYYSSTVIEGSVTLPISMRTAPTLNIISGTNYYLLSKNGGNDSFNSLSIVQQPTVNTVTLTNTTEVSGTQGDAYSGFTETSVTTSYIAFSAEL
jgi:hypothetical protein